MNDLVIFINSDSAVGSYSSQRFDPATIANIESISKNIASAKASIDKQKYLHNY